MLHRLAKVIVLIAVFGLVVSACTGNDFLFSKDQRVQIKTPRSMQLVSTPFSLKWTSTFGAGTRFAVFVDQAPMAPGNTVKSVLPESCKVDPECPTPSYLEQNFIFETDSHTVAIPEVPPVTGGATWSFHTATVVLLDRAGRRIGDFNYTVEFRTSKVVTGGTCRFC